MRTRDKIWILLFAVTLSLAALIVMLWGDDADTLLHFRRLLFRNPMVLMTDGILDRLNSAKVWYGGTGLVAVIMFGLLLKTVRGGEIQAFRERLVATEVAKAELATLLQDTVWKEKHALQAKDAAIRDLQAGMNTLLVVERQLAESEKLLRSRDSELKALRSRLDSVETRPGEMVAASMQQQSELGDELRKKAELLQEKDSALKQLEKNLTGKLQALETQLSLKDKLLNDRGKELEALKGQLAERTAATNQAGNSLAEELRKEQQALQAKDSAMKEIEKNLTAKLHALEIELNEKQDLLRNRNTELSAFKSEVTRLTALQADMALAMERTENSLQQELKNKTEALQSKDAAFKDREGALDGKIHALESQLLEKQEFLHRQSGEL